MAHRTMLDVPDPLALRLSKAGVGHTQPERVIVDDAPPVRARTPSPAPIRGVYGHEAPTARRTQTPKSFDRAVEEWLADVERSRDPQPPESADEAWDAELDATLEPVEPRILAAPEAVRETTGSVPEDTPSWVLVIPLALGIAVIVSVVGMVVAL
jgi:hypothetical protein